MIKAMMSNKQGKKTLVLVLERGNITRLTELRKPIAIRASNMEMKDFSKVEDIVIMFYETQAEALKQMSEHISDNTKLNFGDYGEQ